MGAVDLWGAGEQLPQQLQEGPLVGPNEKRESGPALAQVILLFWKLVTV